MPYENLGFKKLFGEAGIGTRIAVGTNELPEGSPVEITAIVEVTD